MVVDAMNFRVQVLDRSGQFRYAIGAIGEGTRRDVSPQGNWRRFRGRMYTWSKPSGAWCRCSTDKANFFITSGIREAASASFDFLRGCGLTVTTGCFVVDSYNRRVQVFQV